MFGSRRHRQPNQPLTTSTANPSAATAALSAFKRRDPNPSPSLSASAAAAALKARPHTPTDVSTVQTKRTTRRSASVSSRGSVAGSVDNNARPGLQRRGSSGSMTERSFRSPSPHRPGSSGGGHRYAMSQDGADRPPVPSIPRDIVDGQGRGQSPAQGQGRGQSPAQQPARRVNSLGIVAPPLRVGSQRLKDERQGAYFRGAAVGDLSNARKSDAVMREAVEPHHAAPQQDDGASLLEARPSSRSSVNFSYPQRVRSPPASPTVIEDRVFFPPPREQQQQQQPRPVRHQRVSSATSSERSVARAPSVASVQSLVYDPNSRRMVPRYEPVSMEQTSFEQPRTRRKKKQEPSREGSHLAQGTLGRSRGSEIPENYQPPVIDTRQKEPEHAPEPERDGVDYAEPAVKATVPRAAAREDRRAQIQRQAEEVPESPSNYAPEVDTRQYHVASPRPVLNKKPSIVHEESEPENDQIPAVQPESRAIFEALDALPVKQNLYEPAAEASQPAVAPAAVGVATTSPVQLSTERDAATQPSERSGESSRVSSSEHKQTSPPPASRQPNPQVAKVSTRTHSNSPVRTAHFGPILDNNLGIKHSPPPRSISPRKSALKQSASPSRGASPSTDTSEGSFAVNRPGRKKSVRVSFNEDSVVLGETDIPDRAASQSPQAARKPWYSNIGRSKKKDMVSLDDDEVMKPRPALPSFGSVRGKKEAKEPEERPLVRPAETAYSPSVGTSPAVTPGTEEDHQMAEPPLEASSDVALGSLLMQEQQRNAANISRFREPLPPVVTSIESHDYVSDSSSSSESEPDATAYTPMLTQESSALTSQTSQLTEADTQSQPLNGSSKAAATLDTSAYENPTIEPTPALATVREAEHEVPIISVTHPSQERLTTVTKEPKKHLDVPGTFPDDESDSVSTHSSKRDEVSAPQMAEVPSSKARQATFEPVAQAQDAAHGAHVPSTVIATQPSPITDVLDDESETGSSIYSDAYEDLSDVDGDGFLSLNAVVESPMATSATKSPFTSATGTPQQSTPQSRSAQVKAILATAQESGQAPKQPGGDWEMAKSYWRSLTAEKRAQLEREAMEDAGIDADLEEPQQDKKPRRKKSVEKKAAEKKAMQQAHGNSDRTYMIKPGTRVTSDAYTPPAQTGHMQKTLRGQQAPRQQQAQPKGEQGPRLRKSMRTNGVPQAQASAPEPPRPTINKAARRQSFPLPEREDTRGHGRTMSDSGPPPYQSARASMAPTLRRRGSDSSESSFRRVRPQSSGGGFGFRKTMRQETPPMPESPVGTKDRSHRFSLRSLSPGGSPFRRSSVASPPPMSMGMGGMRMSMRDSQPKEKSGGLHMPSFGSKKPAKASKSKAKASRFDDSSDEDNISRGFRSRFEDSSDEDIAPQPIRPLAIPKTMRQPIAHKSPPLPEEDEDSPDLPEEDEKPTTATRPRPLPVTTSSFDRKPTSSTSIGTSTLRRTRSGRGVIAPPASPPPNTRRASASGGLFSALRRKKTDDGKVARGEVMDSAARRDTKLERSASELAAMRAPAGHRTLQKRVASVPSGIGRGGEAPSAWPLSGRVEEIDEDEEFRRPATSSGGEASGRPVAPRRSFSQGVLGSETIVEAGEKKKKKKFGALRRMLRLDD